MPSDNTPSQTYTPQPNSKLLSLPTEIITMITLLLDGSDLLSFRETCKQISILTRNQRTNLDNYPYVVNYYCLIKQKNTVKNAEIKFFQDLKEALLLEMKKRPDVDEKSCDIVYTLIKKIEGYKYEMTGTRYLAKNIAHLCLKSFFIIGMSLSVGTLLKYVLTENINQNHDVSMTEYNKTLVLDSGDDTGFDCRDFPAVEYYIESVTRACQSMYPISECLGRGNYDWGEKCSSEHDRLVMDGDCHGIEECRLQDETLNRVTECLYQMRDICLGQKAKMSINCEFDNAVNAENFARDCKNLYNQIAIYATWLTLAGYIPHALCMLFLVSFIVLSLRLFKSSKTIGYMDLPIKYLKKEHNDEIIQVGKQHSIDLFAKAETIKDVLENLTKLFDEHFEDDEITLQLRDYINQVELKIAALEKNKLVNWMPDQTPKSKHTFLCELGVFANEHRSLADLSDFLENSGLSLSKNLSSVM